MLFVYEGFYQITMNIPLKILFVEDVKSDAELICYEINKKKIEYQKLLVDTKEGLIEAIKSYGPDIIISDYSLPQLNGMMALSIRNEMIPLTPFLLVTGSINEEVAVECIKAGADDYILKENLSRLGPAIISSINKSLLKREKSEAEAELYRSQQRLRKAQAMAHIGNWELDLSSKSVLCSDEALLIYGFDPTCHEVSTELMKNIPLAEYRPVLAEALNHMLKYSEPYEVEYKIKRHNDNEIRWIVSMAELSVESGSNRVKVVGVIQDITDRKRVETELQHSYVFNKSLLDTIPFGMDIVDESGTVLFQSDNFERLVGEKSLGEKCWEMYKDDKMQCTGCPLLAGITIGQTDIYESHGVLGNRIFEISHTGMMYQGKKAILEIFQDITERKESEQELISAKVKAEESDKLKTAFLHNISHEIRTPMNAIVGFSALLGEPDTDAASTKSYIEVILQSSNHLLSIISDIVDISNIEANLIKLVRNEIDIKAILQTIYSQFSPKADAKKILIDFEIRIPDSGKSIITDKTKLTEILSNIISNALKFTDKGSIRLSCILKGQFLEFSVTDTGIGIPEQYHRRVFDRFYQVQNSTSRLYEGTGLGLAISKAYVELLGGQIWLESETGKGSTFYFTIPYEIAVAKQLPVIDKKAPDCFEFPEKKVVLVAEDIDSNLKLIKYFLAGSNTEIIHACNGKEAVDKFLSSEKVDIILMDIKMPVMDGYTAARLIREKNKTVPIIAQTAYADDREKAIECGCTGFISKPFDKKGLFKALCEHI